MKSFLSTFDSDLFVDHRSWHALERALESRTGGSYGLSGPRGAGKSWLMERARLWAASNAGVGVWFPSPSEYEATAFLAALSDVTASKFEQWYDEKTGRTTKLARRRGLALSAGGYLLAYLGAGLVILTIGQSLSIRRYVNVGTVIGALICIAGLLIAVRGLVMGRRTQQGLRRVRSAAEELRLQVRYIVTTKESSEIGGESSYGGFAARLKRASERQLVERPATLSSLIHNFRAFAELTATEIDAPVVVAIDELDKMSDATKVAELLRDVKGIFEVPGVYFLVSLSDEAARSLELGAVRARNEFNSSFYTVFALDRFSPEQVVRTLQLRVPEASKEFCLVVAALTGGIPRETVRVADAVYEEAELASTVGPLVARIMRTELDTFIADVLGAGSEVSDTGESVSGQDKLALWRCAGGSRDSPYSAFNASAPRILAQWDLNDSSTWWQHAFQEQWRRIVTRVAVGVVIVEYPDLLEDGETLRRLQKVVATASADATVARTQLAELLLTTELPRGEGDASGMWVAVEAFLRGGQVDAVRRRQRDGRRDWWLGRIGKWSAPLCAPASGGQRFGANLWTR